MAWMWRGLGRGLVAVVSIAVLSGGCAAAPAGGAPGGGAPGGGAPGGGAPGGGAQGGGGAAGGSSPAAATASAGSTTTYPDHFSGTIGGSNGVDSWTGSAILDRRPEADDCNQAGAVVCYGIAGGSVIWAVAGVSTILTLDPTTAADGLVLFVADQSHPDRNGTYEISVTPSTAVYTTVAGSPRYAFETVRDWVNVIDFPQFDRSTWHVAGQSGDSGCGIDGCGPGQSWTWDLQGTFGP